MLQGNLETLEIINKNLWLGIPLVLIGYLIFETIQGRFGKQFLDSDYFKNKMMEGQKETKESPSGGFLLASSYQSLSELE